MHASMRTRLLTHSQSAGITSIYRLQLATKALQLHLCHGCSYLSFAAATPGNSLPSKNSREAPPPVEM